MCDKIYLVTHIEKNLLIVLHQKVNGWLFRVVNCQGVVMEEQTGFETPTQAEEAGRLWLKLFTS